MSGAESPSQIASVTATVVSHVFAEQRVRFGLGAPRKRDLILVRVATADGHMGYGETHHANAPTAVAELINHSIAPLAMGQDAFDTEGLWDRVYRYQLRTHGLANGAALAISGVDMALWDVKGKHLGLPVYKLLGGRKQSFRAYVGGATFGFEPAEQIIDRITAFREASGFLGVKLRIGESVSADAQRLMAVRKAFGDDLEIMVDANTRYDFVDCLAILPTLEACNVVWLEEPLARDDTAALAEIQRRTSIPIAVGENHYTRREFMPLLERRAAVIWQPDTSKSGGITEVKKIGDLATVSHVRFAPHTSHSMLNYSSSVHVMSAVGASYRFEADPSDNAINDAVFSKTVVVKDGMVTASDAPGLGVEVDEAALAKFPGQPGPSFRF
jgi:L-alanine-DL-glutamate epimerase-like enolase superfamily enzyme